MSEVGEEPLPAVDICRQRTQPLIARTTSEDLGVVSHVSMLATTPDNAMSSSSLSSSGQNERR